MAADGALLQAVQGLNNDCTQLTHNSAIIYINIAIEKCVAK